MGYPKRQGTEASLNRSGLAILVSACALLFAQPAFAGTTRYASPSGGGTTCSEALPCDLAFAVTGLVSGDSVVLGSGTYDLGTTSLLTPPGVSLIGAAGTRPTITGGPAIGALLNVSNASVQHLAVTQTAGAAATAITSSAGSKLEDLVVSSAGGGVGLGPADVLRDSVIRLTGDSGVGISGSGLGSMDVRNVLVSAPGASTVGIQANGFCIMMPMPPDMTMACMPPMFQPTVNVRNSIIRAASDVVTSSAGANGIVNLAYSDYRVAKTTASPAGTIVDQGGNIEGDPLFADAANGDFHQVAGSPTIDAGDPAAATDALVGALDFDGLARILGSRIDMGPDEFVPAATGNGDGGSQQGGGSDTATPPGDQTPPAGDAAGSATPDKTAPVIKSLRVAPGVLRRSALVSYLLSERATTTLKVVRKTRGVKKGRTCTKAGRKVKKRAKRCTRWVSVRGNVVRADAGGKSSFRFNGKLRGKRLAVGSYRLIAIARDGAGNVGKPVTVAFRVSATRSKA